MWLRINIPFLFHFQTWDEDRPSGRPFISRDKESGVVYIGRWSLQLNLSEGNFFLLEASFIRFQLGQLGMNWPS